MNLFSLLTRPQQYLDPASGSLIVQILLAAVMGIGVAIGVFWKNIKAFFKGKKGNEAEYDPTEIEEEQFGQTIMGENEPQAKEPKEE